MMRQHLLLKLFIFGFVSNFVLYAQEMTVPVMKLGKEVPQDKKNMIISRIADFSHVLTENDYSLLQSLWNNPFDNVSFDGNFTVSYSNLDFLNDNPDSLRKFGKGDVSVTLSHWAGDEYSEYPPNFSQNYVILCILDYHTIGSYYEFGKVINESCGVRFHEKSGQAEMFQLETNTEKPIAKKESVLLRWNQDGTTVEYINEKAISLMRDLNDDNSDIKKIPTFWGKLPVCPKTTDKSIQNFLDRMILVMSSNKMDQILDLFDLPLLKSTSIKSCQISYDNWHCQWGCLSGFDVSNTAQSSLMGYAFAKDHSGMPTVYLEGYICLPTTFKSQPQLDQRGIEIRFHPTGYPASYKTIVKNRLFGRQIEWNDQGEVISDVDLAIPMPWSDASSSEAKTSPTQ